MTLDQALSISRTRTVDLWKLCREQVVAGHLQYLDSPDSLREQALDIVTEEVLRLRAALQNLVADQCVGCGAPILEAK